MDCLEEYLRFYDWKLIQATLTDGITDTGWVYIMKWIPPHTTVIKSGNWKKSKADEAENMGEFFTKPKCDRCAARLKMGE